MCVSLWGVWCGGCAQALLTPMTSGLVWEKPGRRASAGLGSAWTYSRGEVSLSGENLPPFLPGAGRGAREGLAFL